MRASLWHWRQSCDAFWSSRQRKDLTMRGRWFRAVAALLFAAVCGATFSGLLQSRGDVEGAAISPKLARSLFERVKALQKLNACRLISFDANGPCITIVLETPAGARRAFEADTGRRATATRSAGDWSLRVPRAVESDCGATVTAIAGVLASTAAPQRSVSEVSSAVRLPADILGLLAAMFVVLLFGTMLVLVREARRLRPSAAPLLALALITGAALALRLLVSPRTFLHEYYHSAGTALTYLTGRLPALYGQTGPALFQLVGGLSGQSDNVQVIFLTNAVLATLAIPALALLDLALMQSWPRALCGAALLSVLPLHLRFSAAEDLYIQGVTFGLWSLALCALHLRSGRLLDALLASVALALAMQTRPDMMTFPAVMIAMVVCVRPRSWRILFSWRTMLAVAVLTVLLVPRLVEFQQALGERTPTALVPDLHRYLDRLVLLQSEVTPLVFRLLLIAGVIWGAWRAPGLIAWITLVFVGYTVTALSLFDNPPYNLRSQLLPTTLTVIVMAGAAPLWMACWGPRRRQAVVVGALVLVALAVTVVISARGFVTELRDQQLEWAFIERTVPQLPQRATLLTVVEIGGINSDAFPQILLTRARKTFDMIDLRRALTGATAWPAAGPDVLFYQGMFCYFASEAEPPPEPMSELCQAVHARYIMEPLFVESLDTRGYSLMRYAPPPYPIGFFRLTALRNDGSSL